MTKIRIDIDIMIIGDGEIIKDGSIVYEETKDEIKIGNYS